MSRRALNPYAQPYFGHHSHHPNQNFLYESPNTCLSVSNLHSMQNPTLNPDHCSNMEAATAKNPRVVVPRRQRNFRRKRNVGPRLRSSQTNLAVNHVQVSRASTDQASNFASGNNRARGGTVAIAPSPSRPGRRNSSRRRKVGLMRSSVRHGVQASSFANGNSSVIPFPESHDEQNGSEVTTLMIKNVPCQLRRSDLLLKLKDHCLEENEKAGSLRKSEFNFLYLPLDFNKFWKKKAIANLGYAFVNFTTAIGALRFYAKYHKSMWKEVTQSSKICEITCAKIQGLEALRKTLRERRYHGLTNEFLPVILVPACDGVRESKHTSVGQLLDAKEIEN